MLYGIIGTDIDKTRSVLRVLTDSLLQKKPNSNIFFLEAGFVSASVLDEKITGQGLFEQKYIVVLNRCLEDKKSKEVILEMVGELAGSENVFIYIEESIDSKTLKILEKNTHTIKRYDRSSAKEKPQTLFALTDAFGERNKKKVWVEYQKALLRGVSSEEIHSMVLWQLRSMVSASKSSSAADAGLKPFVYTKTKKASRNFTENELLELYGVFVDIYHQARRGQEDMEEGIEQQLLAQ